MTIITVFLVLLFDRIVSKANALHIQSYTEGFYHALQAKGWLNGNQQAMVVIFIPVVAYFLIADILLAGVFNGLFALLILYMTVGCINLRASYKAFISSVSRGDHQAALHHAEQIGYTENDDRSFGQHITWINYQRYVAPILFYILLGVYGLLVYVSIRGLHGYAQTHNTTYRQRIERISFIMDWVPVRITAFGFLVVGDFTRAMPRFLDSLVDTHTHAKNVLANIATAAEDIEFQNGDIVAEVNTLLNLAKRNLIFILCVTAILSLFGLVN